MGTPADDEKAAAGSGNLRPRGTSRRGGVRCQIIASDEEVCGGLDAMGQPSGTRNSPSWTCRAGPGSRQQSNCGLEAGFGEIAGKMPWARYRGALGECKLGLLGCGRNRRGERGTWPFFRCSCTWCESGASTLQQEAAAGHHRGGFFRVDVELRQRPPRFGRLRFMEIHQLGEHLCA